MYYVKLTIILVIILKINSSYAVALDANKLIRSICDELNNNNTIDIQEDEQWKIICQELSLFEKDQSTTDNNLVGENIQWDRQPRKLAVRFGGASRGGSRISSGSRSSSGSRTSGSSGSRTSASSSSSSSANYYNTRTGVRYNRPTGWLWSRSRLTFLVVASRFTSRHYSSSSHFTTPSSSSVTYYYCTSIDNTSAEIQCSSANGDTQCCEETNHEAFCCGGSIPNDIQEDMSRATQTVSRIFYTIAALALFMHLFMRRFRR
ncbi:unnamed protein product [Adineta ricciae]|uniref:Uncharacterized protein n=1 Tax=Adineta ricciae TaxID=249248 RepID=A0A814T8B4_ADIRI|nr:unnamed protein product [Adineta ricciae]